MGLIIDISMFTHSSTISDDKSSLTEMDRWTLGNPTTIQHMIQAFRTKNLAKRGLRTKPGSEGLGWVGEEVRLVGNRLAT